MAPEGSPNGTFGSRCGRSPYFRLQTTLVSSHTPGVVTCQPPLTRVVLIPSHCPIGAADAGSATPNGANASPTTATIARTEGMVSLLAVIGRLPGETPSPHI